MRFRGRALAAVVVAVGMLASSATAQADAIFTLDSGDAGFAAAVSSTSSTSENFNAFTTDTSLSSNSAAPSSFAGFDAYYTGASAVSGIDVQKIDTAPFFVDIDGTPYLLAYAGSSPSGRTFMLPDAGTTAMSFEFAQWGDGSNSTELSVVTNLGTYTFNPNPTSSSSLEDGFLGFYTNVAGETILQVTWNPIGLVDGIGVDNVQVYAAAVPEPGTLALLGLGLAGLGWHRRRKMSAKAS